MSNAAMSAMAQLHATGPLDDFLTKNPEVSPFTYEVHQTIPFSKNTTTVNFNEKFDFGKLLTTTLPRVAPLVNTMYLYVRLPPLSLPVGSTYFGWTNAVGYAMIEYIEIRIGETVIDRQTGRDMELMDYLATSADKTSARFKCVGRYDNVKVLQQNALGYQDLFIPLQFWFNKTLDTSFPLASLSQQSVK